MYTVDETRDDLGEALGRAVAAFNRAHNTTWTVAVDGDGCRVEDRVTHVCRLLDYRCGRPFAATLRRAASLWNQHVTGSATAAPVGGRLQLH